MIPGDTDAKLDAVRAIQAARRLCPTRGPEIGEGAIAQAGMAQAFALLAVEHRLGQLVDRLDAMTGMLDEKPWRVEVAR